MQAEQLKNIIEAALLASSSPLDVDAIVRLFADGESPNRDAIREALDSLQSGCEGRGIELSRVASGWRYQVRADYAEWVSRLWEEKPQRYSRAMLETLALIAYRQPITRPEIEDVRGVAVSSNIIRTLLERDWVKVVGQRDVPGRPSLYGTTKTFLDYFDLKSLGDLPSLAEIRDFETINAELELNLPGIEPPPTPAAAESEASAQQQAAEPEASEAQVSEEQAEQPQSDADDQPSTVH